jgi:ribosomal protein L37AE/L43A
VLSRLRHVWYVLTAKYDCDVCGRTIHRWRGRASVGWETRLVPQDISGRRRAPGSFLVLRCPECAAALALRRIASAAKVAAARFEALVAAAARLGETTRALAASLGGEVGEVKEVGDAADIAA